MTRDDVVRMARESGGVCRHFGTLPDGTSEFIGAEFSAASLERFVALVAAHEREQCAKLCEQRRGMRERYCAEAIRARGES